VAEEVKNVFGLRRVPLNQDDYLRDVLEKMAEDNPGARWILLRILGIYGKPGIRYILILDDMNIRGTQIFIGYKQHCQSDLGRFVECIEQRSPELVETINNEGCKGRYPHKATVCGGVREMLWVDRPPHP